MAKGLPDGREASYRLLDLQAIPQFGGVIVRRGLARLFLEGERAAAILDLLVEQSARGRPIVPERLRLDLPESDRGPLQSVIDTLKAHRFLVPVPPDGSEVDGGTREDVLFWNYGTSAAAVGQNVSGVRLVVFGVNAISLALLGNLRSCGFRAMAFVDHPALRNPDFFDSRGRLRPEILTALTSPPRSFEDYSAGEGELPDCYVACSDFGGLALMREWNRVAVEKNVLFYPVVLQDQVSYLGPLVAPGDGPCFECFWLRQNANLGARARERVWEIHAQTGRHATGYLQPMARGAADLAAVELLKFFGGAALGGWVGRLVEADLFTPSIVTRTILKVPRCPVCAEIVRPAPAAEEPAPETAEPGLPVGDAAPAPDKTVAEAE